MADKDKKDLTELVRERQLAEKAERETKRKG
jgi:hypothetical protein